MATVAALPADEAPLSLRDQILDLSRQAQKPWSPESPFNSMLDRLIESGDFRSGYDLEIVNASIIRDTAAYRVETGIDTVVLGMSGGVDSALCAAIFKKAGYRVIGVTMPINQNPAETDRGVEACRAIGIEHRHIDLSALYDQTLNQLSGAFTGQGPGLDPDLGLLGEGDEKAVKVRRGNIRARLRMITLYNLAQLEGGFVASTDNFSELSAGFWTLHGDVGDFSPIQSLLKSWEVPYLARLNGVPESTVRAVPTDGLGIDAGDEAQLGTTYLEWDMLLLMIGKAVARGDTKSMMVTTLGIDALIYPQFEAVMKRAGATWFKRKNPLNVVNPLADRYGMLDRIDNALFVPKSFKA